MNLKSILNGLFALLLLSCISFLLIVKMLFESRTFVKVFILFLLLVISLNVKAQYSPRFSAGINVLPELGAGVSVSYYLQDKTGLFVSYSHSTGWSKNRFEESQKVSAGIEFIHKQNVFPVFMHLGASYNTYKNVVPFYNSKSMTQPFDFQFGAGMLIHKIRAGFRYDVIKNDASIDVMVNFGKVNIRRRK